MLWIQVEANLSDAVLAVRVKMHMPDEEVMSRISGVGSQMKPR